MGFADAESEIQIGLGTHASSLSWKMVDPGIPALSGLSPTLSSSIAAFFHGHLISISDPITLNLHLFFS